MIPTYELDDDQWNRLVQDVADHFSDVTLSRGFQYYKQGRVLKLTIPSQRYVKAIVEGSENYSVEINLDFFTANVCDCPVSRNCKHMFAVLLKYADLHNRSVHMLVNAKTTALSRQPDKPPAYNKSYNHAKQLEARKAAENELLLKQKSQHIPVMSIPEWHELFELCTTRLTQSSRNVQFVNDALQSIFRMKSSLPPELEELYSLHAHLFVQSKLTKQPQDRSEYLYSYLAFHVHHAASDLQEKITQCLFQCVPIALNEANSQRVEQTLDYLRKEMLAETNENYYFLAQYQNLWRSWLCPVIHDTLPYSEELQRLEEEADDAAPLLSSYALQIAQAGMHMHQSNDQEAWRLLSTAKETSSDIPLDHLLYMLDYLVHTEQWARLAAWLVEIAPLLRLRRNERISPYAVYWDLTVQRLPDLEKQMWDTLASLLPHSRTLYEEKLLNKGMWERWMDYQLSINCDPADYRVTDLQPMEKNAPEVLLPFYHQAVERYVLIKNRDGYKAAVKLLKRLAKLYKKMKQEPRWELFLTSFVSRNSRLRALQEELRKGKLLQ